MSRCTLYKDDHEHSPDAQEDGTEWGHSQDCAVFVNWASFGSILRGKRERGHDTGRSSHFDKSIYTIIARIVPPTWRSQPCQPPRIYLFLVTLENRIDPEATRRLHSKGKQRTFRAKVRRYPVSRRGMIRTRFDRSGRCLWTFNQPSRRDPRKSA